MMYDMSDLMFVVGTGHQGRMTEIWLLEKSKVLAKDPSGLKAVDSSQLLGVPANFIRTAPGVAGLASFMGTGEQARQALTGVGLVEAPIAWDREAGSLVYVTKDSEVTSRISPRTRTLHRLETVTLAGMKATRVSLFHRFPGEDDWAADFESLNSAVANVIAILEDDGSFTTIHDAKLVSEWLTMAKVPLSED
jgi:hypothetical protein